MRKFVAYFLMLVMTISILSGCGGSLDENDGIEGEQSQDVDKSSKVEGEKDQELGSDQDDFEEKLTFTMNIIDTDKQGNDIRYDYLEEKFNIEFDLVSCSLNDVDEKVRIWVAGGDMPDIMWTGIENVGELRTWAQSGALKELPDLTPYPNLKAILETTQSDDVLEMDGKNYFLTTARDISSVNFMSNQVFIYRKDWAKELGLYKESYTWEEMMELAKAMVSEDPGQNGKGKTLGLTSVKWAYPSCIGLQQLSPYWDGFFLKDGEYVWGAEQPETIEAVKLAKRMYDEGVIWDEQALAQNADGPAKFAAGQVGILYHNLVVGNVYRIISGLEEAYPGEDVLDKIEIMNIQSPDGTYFNIQLPDVWGSLCFSANASDEVVHRFLTFLDFMASEEGIRLQRFGVEGVDYEIKDGNIEILWDKDEAGNYISPYPEGTDRLLSLVQLNEYEKAFTELVPEKVRVIMNQIKEYQLIDNQNAELVDYEYKAFSAPNKDRSTLSGDTKNKIIELLITSDDIETDYRVYLEEQVEKKNAILEELKELNNN